MNDRVSQATAELMKAAGFPQPITEAGQYWFHNQFPSIYFLWSNGFIIIARSQTGSWVDAPDKMGAWWSFAPSLTDILREIGDDARAEFITETKRWRVTLFAAALYYEHENPAEAGFLAWIEWNKLESA